jgi:hypothetical protein
MTLPAMMISNTTLQVSEQSGLNSVRESGYCSREATPTEDPQSTDDEAGAVDRLVVTFNELLKTPLLNGMQFGTNTLLSHVLLGHRGTRGISTKQYNIIMDDDLCIWLHDFHSTHGTAVGHNGQNQMEVRKKETWILAYAPGAWE